MQYFCNLIDAILESSIQVLQCLYDSRCLPGPWSVKWKMEPYWLTS